MFKVRNIYTVQNRNNTLITSKHTSIQANNCIDCYKKSSTSKLYCLHKTYDPSKYMSLSFYQLLSYEYINFKKMSHHLIIEYPIAISVIQVQRLISNNFRRVYHLFSMLLTLSSQRLWKSVNLSYEDKW